MDLSIPPVIWEFHPKLDPSARPGRKLQRKDRRPKAAGRSKPIVKSSKPRSSPHFFWGGEKLGGKMGKRWTAGEIGTWQNQVPGHCKKQLIVLLVGGLNPSEKYESQLGWLFPIYGKIKLMFQTTNQIRVSWIAHLHRHNEYYHDQDLGPWACWFQQAHLARKNRWNH